MTNDDGGNDDDDYIIPYQSFPFTTVAHGDHLNESITADGSSNVLAAAERPLHPSV